MSEQQSPARLNDLLALRGALFAAPWFSEMLADVYGTRLIALKEPSLPPVAHVRTLSPRRVMLAPFNFQPALRDEGERMARALLELAGTERARMRLRTHYPLPEAFVAAAGLSATSDSVESLIDLRGGYEAMLGRARPRRRTQLRKTQEACTARGVSIEVTPDVATVFAVMLRAYRDKHRMITQPRRLFERLAARHDACRIYLARDRSGAPLGAIVMLIDETQWLYGWGANTPAGEDIGISGALIARALEDAARHVSLFSLGASPLSHESLRQFKRSWGAEEHALFTYHWGEAASAVDYHEGWPLARAIIRHTPLAVLSALSAPAVRWLV